jgi:hypothetical protein
VEKYGTDGEATDDNTMQRIRFACRIIKLQKHTTEYVILITFLQYQYFSESVSVLRHAHTARLVTVSALRLKKTKINLICFRHFSSKDPQLYGTHTYALWEMYKE